MDTGPAIFNADPDSDVINFSNPFDDTSSHDKMAEIIGTFLNTVESVIDLASFQSHLLQERYMHAGVFGGKGLVNLVNLFYELFEELTKSEYADVLATID